MTISIIIPIYNLEDHISNCLKSIISTTEEYEIILVNDGSTDKSAEICNSYAERYDNIHVIHQYNQGVSVARNAGISKAKGRWICFIDGDDEISPSSINKIIELCKFSDSEIIVAKSHVKRDGIICEERYSFDQSFLNQSFIGYELLSEKSYKRGSVCGCLFNREFLLDNNIFFPVGLKNGEDSIFMAIGSLYASKISFIAEEFYLVNERENSASRNITFERVYRMVDNIDFINQYIKANNKLLETQKAILNYNIYSIVSAILNYYYSCFSIKTFSKLLRRLKGSLQSSINTGGIILSKHKIKLLNMSLFLFFVSIAINNLLKKNT